MKGKKLKAKKSPIDRKLQRKSCCQKEQENTGAPLWSRPRMRTSMGARTKVHQAGHGGREVYGRPKAWDHKGGGLNLGEQRGE